jgi:hypothetical protein
MLPLSIDIQPVNQRGYPANGNFALLRQLKNTKKHRMLAGRISLWSALPRKYEQSSASHQARQSVLVCLNKHTQEIVCTSFSVISETSSMNISDIEANKSL